MHGMSPSRPRGCVQANYQHSIPNLQFTHCISCMNEVNKCFGKGFGWICALNRWSVQERAHTSFCPIACQVLHDLAWELCRQIAAWYLSRLTLFLLVWGVRKGVWGGGSFWAGGQKCSHECRFYFWTLLRVLLFMHYPWPVQLQPLFYFTKSR